MVNVRNSNVDSILFIRSAERDHSGKYELVLQIENMEDRASIEIRVIGEVHRGLCGRIADQDALNLWFLILSEKPGPPRNVRVTDIWGFNAALEWDIPKDDGNSEITGYTIQKADMKTKVRRGRRFGWHFKWSSQFILQLEGSDLNSEISLIHSPTSNRSFQPVLKLY